MTMRKSRKSAQPVRNPARSFDARRTKVAAPPVSGMRRGALRVRERDDEEEQPREQEHERREPERGSGDDPERDVERGRDLAVGDREQRRRVEHALEAADLTGHVVSLSRLRRPTPSATNRPPRRNPTTPPPCAAVATSSAIPIPTNATENASTAQEYSFTRSPHAATSTRQGACFRT